jgi:FMN phosphatase YigB (HAD superfamily)
MPVSAVIFDAFGTLMKIREGTHPYRQVLKLGIEQGRRPRSSDATDLLTNSLDLKEAAHFFGIKIEPDLMNRLEAGLSKDLANIEAFADGLSAVTALLRAGVKVAVCSNLAKPYAAAVERLYPHLDGYSYSFSVGATKPSPEIYLHVTGLISTPPQEVWMIGDSLLCDCDGPARFGMKGFHLDRSGRGTIATLTQFANEVLIADAHDRCAPPRLYEF